jgi:hypothetical protein
MHAPAASSAPQPAAPSFRTALLGFLSSTAALTVAMVLLSGI